jgi:hypothetical protein
MRAARAAAPPPVEPEADICGFHGLRVAPNRAFTVLAPAAYSGVLVLPTITPPASLMRAIMMWSCVGTLSAIVGEP